MARPSKAPVANRSGALRAADIAAEIDAALQSLPTQGTPSLRAVRRTWSRTLRQAPGRSVLAVAMRPRCRYGHRFVPYELVASHPGAYRLLTEARLEALGRGLDSWSAADTFARTLAGPAWRDGLIADAVILRWAHSLHRWWRRAALVSTVALNVRSNGGRGDVRRTLRVCRLLEDDHDEMVEKALSWALRELVVRDRRAVEAFLEANQGRLGSRVKREVRNKIRTGLKTPHPAARG
jgi:3-methyladenine DNA glycosylase AlkD